MIEAAAEDMLIQEFQKAVKAGTKACQPVIRAIRELAKSKGKPKRPFEPPPHLQTHLSHEVEEPAAAPLPADVVRDACFALCEMRLRDVFTDASLDKVARDDAMFGVRTETVEKLKEAFPDWDVGVLTECFWQVAKKLFRDLIFETHTRYEYKKFTHSLLFSLLLTLFKKIGYLSQRLLRPHSI
jgi:polyribonucleotide nucleotidyltransferase